MKAVRRLAFGFVILSILAQMAAGQKPLVELSAYNDPPSRLRGVIEKFDEDYGILDRFYTAQTSPNRSARFRQLYADEMAVLDALDFEKLNHDEQVDYVLFKNYLEHEKKEQARSDAQLAEMSQMIPFAIKINEMILGPVQP